MIGDCYCGEYRLICALIFDDNDVHNYYITINTTTHKFSSMIIITTIIMLVNVNMAITHLSMHPSIYVSTHVSITPSIHLSIFHPSIHHFFLPPCLPLLVCASVAVLRASNCLSNSARKFCRDPYN